MKAIFKTSIALLAALATGLASARPDLVLPDLGSAGMGAISAAEEESIGRQIIRQMHDAGMIMEDPELAEYIQDIGNRLVAAADSRGEDFDFFVIRDDSVNAFALPGGYIGVHTGLIRRTSNESELAGVMAHEIAHVTQRHIARRLEEGRSLGWKALAAMLGALAVAAAGGDGDDVTGTLMLGQGLLQQEQINFTRSQEYEADRVGIDLLAAAGFDPDGMTSFFETMQRRQRLQGIRLPEYFSTHPLGTSRVVEASQRARAMGPQDSHESRLYPLMKTRLEVMWDDQRTEVEPIRGNGIAVQHYRAALQALQLGNTERAVEEFSWLLEKDDSLIPYHLGLARAHAAARDRSAALAAVNEALRLFPESVPVNLTYARIQRDFGEADRGLRQLRRLYDYRSPTPEALRLMAQLAAEAGASAESHFYLSEYYIRQGDLSSARTQLELAVDQAALGSDEKRQYRARLEEIAEVLAQQRQQRRQRPAGRRVTTSVY